MPEIMKGGEICDTPDELPYLVDRLMIRARAYTP
jgi:hypothetical protein